MIHLNGVTDEPSAFGSRQRLLVNVDLDIPAGRYALLSPVPELHRQIIDVLCRLRPPSQGFVKHGGRVSWAIGRQGFIRGKANGLHMIQFVCEMYELDADATVEFVADIISDPNSLTKPMEHWPLYVRQEFSFALALAPAFDVYVIEGAMPFEPCRFTRLWLALFEERLVGRTLVFSSYRQNQMADNFLKVLFY
jgi:capsular polysaccharide transport system ATP-binding protein